MWLSSGVCCVVFKSQFRCCVLWCGRIPRPAVSASAEDHTDNLSSYLSLSQVQRGILFQSDQCDTDFKTENGLRIHKGKYRKEGSSGVCNDHTDNLSSYVFLSQVFCGATICTFPSFAFSCWYPRSLDVTYEQLNTDLFLVFSTSNCLFFKSQPFRKRRNASSKLLFGFTSGMRHCTARLEG